MFRNSHCFSSVTSPYNVMNVLLASSSTLSFSCYFWCTALSLPKLLVHCSVGTTIRSFAESAQDRSKEGFDEMVDYDDDTLAREKSGERMKAIAGIVGILLCVGKSCDDHLNSVTICCCSTCHLQASSSTCLL